MIKHLRPQPRKNRSSKAWLLQHITDHWVTEATRLGYRSRAAFKLLELAQRDALFHGATSAVDLGASPGSWSQVLHEKLGRSARIVAVDILKMAPVPGVHFVQGDFRDEAVLSCVEEALAGVKVDLVVSDMSPNLSGVDVADQARSVHLGELALDFAKARLQPGGDLVVKAFQGQGFAELRRAVEAHFTKVYVRKPKASRDRSREVYLVGKTLKAED